MTTHATLQGRYFDGRDGRRHAVDVEVAHGRLRVRGDGIDRDEPLAALTITPRLARTLRTIAFPDGARLQVPDAACLEVWFPHRNRLEALVDRLERYYQAVALAIVVCLGALVAGYLWGIPWLADRIATHLPARVEAALGDQVLALLDRTDLDASALDPGRQAELSDRFATLAAGLPDGAAVRVVFRGAPSIGPNAFALPGGTVVVTDELVELFADDRQLDAVLAHELGHQVGRHALRQALRSSFIAIAAAFFAGDVSSASAVVVAVPTVLLQNRYSRQFEDEADRFAYAHLAAHALSPSWLGAALGQLDADLPDDASLAWMSSHPATAARIAAADAAGADFVARHPELADEEPDVVLAEEDEEAVDGPWCACCDDTDDTDDTDDCADCEADREDCATDGSRVDDGDDTVAGDESDDACARDDAADELDATIDCEADPDACTGAVESETDADDDAAVR